MRRVEATAEQLFQEAYFADRCLESNDPVFISRGKRILKTHEEENRTSNANNLVSDDSRDIWRPNPDAGIDEEDPRSTLAYKNFKERGIRVDIINGHIVPIELVINEPIDPSQQVH